MVVIFRVVNISISFINTTKLPKTTTPRTEPISSVLPVIIIRMAGVVLNNYTQCFTPCGISPPKTGGLMQCIAEE